jgi:hypothetical protein
MVEVVKMDECVVRPALAIILSFLGGGLAGVFGSVYFLNRWFDKVCDYEEPKEEDQDDL